MTDNQRPGPNLAKGSGRAKLWDIINNIGATAFAAIFVALIFLLSALTLTILGR